MELTRFSNQSYNNVHSPNEMVVDTGDYVGVANEPDKDPVAIINPDSSETEADQLHDLPAADDRASPSLSPDLQSVLCLF